MKFKSENSVYYIEDEILTIAFADSKKPDPNRYLILQREVDNSEIYYYEVNSQMYSNAPIFFHKPNINFKDL